MDSDCEKQAEQMIQCAYSNRERDSLLDSFFTLSLLLRYR